MSVDIARVFSDSWTIIKQRFFQLLGMWIVFFVLNLLYTMIGGAFIGGSVFAMGATAASVDDPGMLLGGLGIGVAVMMFAFYLGSIVIIFAQQCAMSALGTPLRPVQFNDALMAGFKGGVTFIAIAILLAIAYFAFFLVSALIGLVLSAIDGAAVLLTTVLFFPLLVYLALRLSVIVPVVAVDRVFNPLTAIRRTWGMTSGKVLSILGVYLVIIAIALVLLGIPFFLMFGSVFLAGASGSDAAGLAAAGSMIGGFLLLIPMFLIYSVIAIVISACLHAQLTDTRVEEATQTFS
ncbi:hypothetical protein NAP1_08437 [Erythrobacter sp. NAP1]|uniref:hypothetical protein n=1 Tax=Erythrobacter sp. NAP1 TaxID=237727 RepID=UPI00006851A5|nr:hypothetical protein [Erythrobacter sp. NAP1]EAQ27606.1 hypothetical protein NAP1_08437 [Erythrobacter sp. NAP1]